MGISLRYLVAVILGILVAVLLRSFLAPPAPAVTQSDPYSVTPLTHPRTSSGSSTSASGPY